VAVNRLAVTWLWPQAIRNYPILTNSKDKHGLPPTTIGPDFCDILFPPPICLVLPSFYRRDWIKSGWLANTKVRMEHSRFNARFAGLGIKCIHLTHPIMNTSHHRLFAQAWVIYRILRVWVAIKRILFIGAMIRHPAQLFSVMNTNEIVFVPRTHIL